MTKTRDRDVRGYLASKGWSYTARGHEAVLNCPLCGDHEKKFAINLETGAWNCAHLSRCGRKGSLWLLKKELGDLPERGEVRRVVRSYKRPNVQVRPAGSAVTAWLAGRRISAAIAERYSVQEDAQGRVAFPYKRDGQVLNVKYRSITEKAFFQERDCEPSLFGRDLVPTDAAELIVVEGEMDVLAAAEYGVTAVSVPGGASSLTWLDGEWEWLQRFAVINLALDQDKAGEDGVAALQARLGADWELRRVKLPLKDLNECLMAEIPAAEIRQCIDEAVSLRPEAVKLLAEVEMDVLQDPDPGLPCELPGLATILGGWRPGELTIFAGESFSGKSTATLQEASGILRGGRRVCVANFEQDVPAQVRTMIRQSGLALSEFIYRYGTELLFLELEDPDLEKLIGLMDYVARRFGVQHFVIDSLGIIEIPVSEQYWLKQKEVVRQLSRFSKTRGVHLFLVHHLRKVSKDRSGAAVDHADLEGSVWIRNLADNIVFFKRIEPEDRKDGNLKYVDEVVRVDKNRLLGTVGTVPLQFLPEVKRFEKIFG